MSKKDEKPKRTKVHLSPDLVAAFRTQGDDWEARMEAVLQAHLDKAGKGAGKVRAFFEDVAGPHMPQLEAVARDVAGKVAKDVAMAAAAAMASWAANTTATKAKTPPKTEEPAA